MLLQFFGKGRKGFILQAVRNLPTQICVGQIFPCGYKIRLYGIIITPQDLFSVPPFDQYRLLMTRYKNGVIMRRVPFPICANCPPSKKMCPMGSFVPIKNAIARSAPIEEATTSSRCSTPCDFRYASPDEPRPPC